MLQLEDLTTIQTLTAAYMQGRCDVQDFVREAQAIVARFNPQLTEREVSARVGQILGRLPP